MTPIIRTSRRSSYPALMLFGLVYLMALAIVVSPETFRADRATVDSTAATQITKGTP